LEGRIIRRKAGEIPRSSPEEIARMLAIRDEDIDFSDIPEMPGGQRLYRDENGRLPKRRSVVRATIAATMADREMTNYALWKAAKEHCPTITETAIGQFLKGQRSIGLEYIDAIMAAMGLEIRKAASPTEIVDEPEHPTLQPVQTPGVSRV
jgi:hypothetical protein